jgi:hypothetical protein
MAKVHAPLQIQGAIGTIVISGTQRGGQRAYLKPVFNKDKWRTHPKLKHSRASAISFGGAAKCGSAIYNHVCAGFEGHVMPYAHNHIASRIRRGADTWIYTTRYAFDTAQEALRNLDLSPTAAEPMKKLVRMRSVGPGHAPTHLRIQGLQDAAATIMHDTAQLQCRITVRSMAYPAVQYDAQDREWEHITEAKWPAAWESLWIPIDLLPKEGLLAPIPQHLHFPNEPQLHFAIVAWRQVAPRQLKASAARYKSANRKPRLLKEKTIFRLAAFSTPLGAAQPEARPRRVAARRRYMPVRMLDLVQGTDVGDSRLPVGGLNRPHLMETQMYYRLAMRGKWQT